MKIPKIFGIKDKYSADQPNKNFDNYTLKLQKKLPLKLFAEKTILLNFENLHTKIVK